MCNDVVLSLKIGFSCVLYTGNITRIVIPPPLIIGALCLVILELLGFDLSISN